jgi:hypothetical protein
MKRDSVLCSACGEAFEVSLIELVRWSGPLWCEKCAEVREQHRGGDGGGEGIAEPTPG